jgi:hypothetical protein
MARGSKPVGVAHLHQRSIIKTAEQRNLQPIACVAAQSSND